MGTAVRPRPSTTRRLSTGPWKGVRNTLEPFDEPPEMLQDATDGYIADPQNGSAYYARLGMVLGNNGSRVFGAGTFSGQLVFSHTDLTNTTYNFIAFGGHIFRVNSALTVYTDVTPGGVTIDGAASTKIKMLSVGGTLVVSDGVNAPWIASNLSSTPITGTAIQYDASNDTWSASDLTEYGGSVFYLLNKVAGVGQPFTLAWTEPGQPTLGLQQTNFSNFWNLVQTSNDPPTAIHGTNVALFVFRRSSIAKVFGAVGPNLSSTATTDAVAANVGTLSPRSVFQFSNTIFFSDVYGRPMSIDVYGQPIELWQQLRQQCDAIVVETARGFMSATNVVTSFDYVRNLVIMTVPLTATGVSGGGTPLHLVFHAGSKTYVGRWSLKPYDAIGFLTDGAGIRRIVGLGQSDIDTNSGYVWTQHAAGDSLAYNDSGSFGPTAPVRPTVVTGRMGYSADTIFAADELTVLAGNTFDVAGVIAAGAEPSGFSTAASAVGGVGTPGLDPSPLDLLSRYVIGLDNIGRGIQITVAASSTGGGAVQASIQQITVEGRIRKASVTDA